MSYNNTLQWNQANTKGGEHSDKTYKTADKMVPKFKPGKALKDEVAKMKVSKK